MPTRRLGVARRHLAIAIALTAASLAAACEPSAGRRYALNARLAAVDSVGSAWGDDALRDIVDVAVSPEGRLAVSQYGFGEVWVFDPGGGGRQVFGRRGAEFEGLGILPFLAWRGDTLVAVERYRQRVSFMAADGSYLGGRETRSAAASEYSAAAYLRSGLTLATPQINFDTTTEPKPLLLVGPDDQVVDSVGEFRMRRGPVTLWLEPGEGRVFQHPLPNLTRTAASPDGRHFATADEIEGSDGSELRFVLYDDAGNELGRAAANVVAPPLSDEDLISRLGSQMEPLSERMPAAQVRALLLEAVERPDRTPALLDFLLDDDGGFWAAVPDENGGRVWKRWTIEGDPARTWMVEPDLSVMEIRDDGAVAVRLDELNGPRVIFLEPREES